MSGDRDRLRAVGQLADLLRERDLERLAAARRASAETLSRLAGIDEARQTRSAERAALEVPDAALSSGQDDIWEQKLCRDASVLREQLHLQRQEQEQAHARAQRSFARADVLARLAGR